MTAFIDTNVPIYAFTNDPRAERAKQVLTDGGIISVQVLNEFASVAIRKLRMPWPRITEAIAMLCFRFDPVRPVTIATHEAALVLARDHGLSFYDALIVAAAQEAGCDTLMTEDLQAGRRFGPVQVVNPFV